MVLVFGFGALRGSFGANGDVAALAPVVGAAFAVFSVRSASRTALGDDVDTVGSAQLSRPARLGVRGAIGVDRSATPLLVCARGMWS